jgi:hypothetical protein
VTSVLFEVTIFKTKAGLAWSEVFKRGFSMRFISMIDMGLPQKKPTYGPPAVSRAPGIG